MTVSLLFRRIRFAITDDLAYFLIDLETLNQHDRGQLIGAAPNQSGSLHIHIYFLQFCQSFCAAEYI